MLLLCVHDEVFSADPDVRLARRIRRDTVEKGRDIGTVLDQVRKFPFVYDLSFLKFYFTLFFYSAEIVIPFRQGMFKLGKIPLEQTFDGFVYISAQIINGFGLLEALMRLV